MERKGFEFSQLRKIAGLRTPRRLYLARAAVVGIVAALIAVAFQVAIAECRDFFQLLATRGASLLVPGWLITIALTALAGVAAAWMTSRLAPDASGSGIPQVKARLLHLRTLNTVRVLFVKFIGGTLALAAGFSLGREGPSIHLGAVAAGMAAKWMRIPSRARDHLIACGAGAGLAAAFNAPLAGFIFVIEELRRELSPLTYGSAFIAAVLGDFVMRLFLGASPVLQVNAPALFEASVFPFMLVVGGVAGLAGVGFSRVLLLAVRQTPSTAAWVRGGAVGLLIGVMGLFFTSAVAPAQHLLENLLSGSQLASLGFGYLLALLAVKLSLTILSYYTGVPGGIFAPMLLHGTLVGLLLAKLAAVVGVATAVPAGVVAVTAMAAYFSAAVGAPLTAVVLIIELTGSLQLLFPVLAACLASYLIGEALGHKPIYEALMQLSLRTRRAEGLPSEPFVMQLVVEPHSAMDGARLRDLRFPQGCLFIGVTQGGVEHVPSGTTELSAGDQVTVLVDPDVANDAERLRQAATAGVPDNSG